MTANEAVDEMFALFRVTWLAGSGAWNGGTAPQVFWDGIGVEGPKPQEAPWARVSARHATGRQATLMGDAGTTRHRQSGIIAVQVFYPLKLGGVSSARGLAEVAASAFRGAATAGGVWFRNVTVREIGLDKAWYNVNALAEFEYDELV